MPARHGPQVPPQSVSVSVPFFTASSQLGARQSESLPHTSLAQSELSSQLPPVGQPGQVPPQSLPVSSPF
jgi:hypothetical protein